MENKLTNDSICIPSEDVVAREIEGDIIIVPLVSGIGDADDELYTLNDTGKAIWRNLDGKNSLGHVAEILAGEYAMQESDIAGDVFGFASEMVRRGILKVKI